MGNESFINAIVDTYSVEDVMEILGLDDEFVIRRCLKSLILANRERFTDIYDMED